MKLFVIAGHGAGDPGACANGYEEAERVRALAARIKAFGGDAVEVADTSRNWYADNGISSRHARQGLGGYRAASGQRGPFRARRARDLSTAAIRQSQYGKALAEFIGGLLPGPCKHHRGAHQRPRQPQAGRSPGHQLPAFGVLLHFQRGWHRQVRRANRRGGEGHPRRVRHRGWRRARRLPLPRPSAPAGGCDVDGDWGPANRDGLREGARHRGRRRGVRAGLPATWPPSAACPSSAWRVGSGGSQMVRALQSKVGASADGYFGPNTCRALQAYLGTEQDGVLSHPSQAVRAVLQRRLNAGTF